MSSRRLQVAWLMLLAACGHPVVDRPRMSAGFEMRDVVFHSSALGRDMTYRVYVPRDLKAGEALPVVYLLHGAGGNFRDWSNYSDVAAFCDRDRWILVMPEGEYSYYANAVARPRDRFEDYVVEDLASDVESRFHTARRRAIIGFSMGGFGAISLALRHPGRFVFAGGLSPAVDVPRRKFSVRRASQWRDHAAIFGPQDGAERRANDPFVLVRSGDPGKAAFLYLWCAEQEGLAEPIREFDVALKSRGFAHEFHTARGGHDWGSWNHALPDGIRSLRGRL
ncbi:MAG TPA: alpha/beta hydrolase family protein [Bryobacteraceae bacterium]|jgi:S-formylglutathione hydrolase FrmB